MLTTTDPNYTSAEKQDRKRYVIIAGNIGVGKSSLTARLAKSLGWMPFYEAANENPYLSDFYADMPRWSFQSQVFFLAGRLQLHRQLSAQVESVVQDRSLYEDAEIFACNLHRQGNFADRDYATYRALYESVRDLLPVPDLLVYLQASVPTLLTRIAQRGRTFEQTIAPDYLAQLNHLYEEWIAQWTLCPIVCIPTDTLDFVRNPRDLAQLAETIQKALEPHE